MNPQNNLVNVTMAGIQCDNEACDFHDDDVSFEDYKQWLKEPCPKCGEHRLTEADMKTANELMTLSGMLKELGEDLLTGNDLDGERVEVELKMKGDGSVSFGEIIK